MTGTVATLPREGRLVLLLGALVAFGPLAIDLYLPALPAIAAGLSATPEAVQLSITVFLAGFALGMLFYGPISDRYGRRTVMLTGISLFVLASLACMVAMLVSRSLSLPLIKVFSLIAFAPGKSRVGEKIEKENKPNREQGNCEFY